MGGGMSEALETDRTEPNGRPVGPTTGPGESSSNSPGLSTKPGSAKEK